MRDTGGRHDTGQQVLHDWPPARWVGLDWVLADDERARRREQLHLAIAAAVSHVPAGPVTYLGDGLVMLDLPDGPMFGFDPGVVDVAHRRGQRHHRPLV
jgi:hypothetical protein